MLFFPGHVIFIVFAIGCIASAVSLIVRSSLADHRVRDLGVVATEIQFKLLEFDSYHMEKMPFSLFRLGANQTAQNVMSGTYNGLPITMFDYHYRVASQSNEYRYFTCALLRIPAVCPWMCLTHESVASRLADHLGAPDVELEYDAFNRRFRVNCEQKFAFTMLDGQMMDWLLGADKFERVEIIGPWVMVARPKLRPEAWKEFGPWLDGFHSHIPPAVYANYPPQ